MDQIKRKPGRPRVPLHLQAKPKSKTIRVPLHAISEMKALARLLTAKVLTAEDVQALIDGNTREDSRV